MSSAPVMKIEPEQRGADTPRASAAWAPLSEAATKLDLSEAQLRRKCQQMLQHQGLAKRLRRESDEKPVWHISRDCDLRLSNSRLGRKHQMPKVERANYSQGQRDRAWARVACVKRYRDLKSVERRPEREWIDHLVRQLAEQYPDLKLGSKRTLKKWAQSYQHPADVIKLIDTRGGNQKAGADPACWDYFRSIFLDKRQPSAKLCWQRTKEYAQAHDLRWIGERNCYLCLNEKIPPQVQAQFREPSKYRSKFAPYIEQHPEAWAARTRWQGDHAQLDFMVKHPTTGKPVRPWITAWLEWRTRRIAGYCLSLNPDSSTILAGLRHGLLHQRDANMGGPDEVCIDNGKDYDSYTFKGQTKAERQQVKKQVEQFQVDETRTEGIFNLLDIEPHFSIPHNPNGKSRVERWFGTLHGQFDKSFRTYCGSHPGDRPEGLQPLLKDSRNLPDFEQVRQRLEDFIAAYNASADHDRADMLGWSPDEAIQAWAPNRRVYASNEALDHCLQMWHQPKMVGKNGITIQVGGAKIGYGYTDPMLRMYKGRRDAKVKVAYDPWDLSSVRVYTEDGRFITEARANPTGGGQSDVTKEQVAKAQRERSQYRSKRREVAQNGHYEYLSTFEIAQREAVQQERQQIDETPLKMVQTPLDEAAQDHQRHQEIQGETRRRRKPRPSDMDLEMPEPPERPRRMRPSEYAAQLEQPNAEVDREDDEDDVNPVDRLAELGRQRASEHEDLGPIDLTDPRPLDPDPDDNGSSHLLDALGKEGGAA